MLCLSSKVASVSHPLCVCLYLHTYIFMHTFIFLESSAAPGLGLFIKPGKILPAQ